MSSRLMTLSPSCVIPILRHLRHLLRVSHVSHENRPHDSVPMTHSCSRLWDSSNPATVMRTPAMIGAFSGSPRNSIDAVAVMAGTR